jgi:2'-5' RNA ligase
VRLFVAVDLPAEVTDKVAALERPRLRSLRWTTPEQWHVTVRFFGEVPEDDLEGPGGLRAALDTVPALLAEEAPGPVEAVLGPAVAWFPGRQVLQVPVGGLDAVAGALSRATGGWGTPPDRPFRGHLTLARARGGARGPASLAGAVLWARWVVGEIVLYRSVLGPDGSRYGALHRVALAG